MFNSASAIVFPAALTNALATSTIQCDSRLVKPGDIFVCHRAKGKQHPAFILQALENQAAFVITQQKADLPEYQRFSGQVLRVKNVKHALDQLTYQKYGACETDFYTVAVTGTNGKSSVAWMLSQLYRQLCPTEHCLYIGTLGIYLDGNKLELPSDAPSGLALQLTSIDLLEMRYLLRLIKDRYPLAKKYLVCEVSSHAIDQQRTGSIVFDQVLLTNLGSDHLDYHHSVEAYHECKLRLLMHNKAVKALVNLDCAVLASKLAQLTSDTHFCPVHTVGFGAHCQFKTARNSNGDYYLVNHNNKVQIAHQNKLLTRNILAMQNVAMAISSLMLQGFSNDSIQSAIPMLENPPGRFQIVNQQPLCMVDFAHTEHALGNAMQLVKSLITGDLWVVFGCGGDRDKSKRAAMGQCAEQYADFIMITHDNNRSEAFSAIEKDISINLKRQYSVSSNRKSAIDYVLNQMKLADGLLVAGMGPDIWQDDDDSTLLTDAQCIDQWFDHNPVVYKGEKDASI